MMKQWLIIIILAAIGLTSVGSYYVIATYDSSYQIILETSKTIIGQDIQYPSNSALITSKIVTFPAGADIESHLHESPIFVYVIEGEITVDYGEYGIKTFQKGDSYMEAVNYIHKGVNNGDKPVTILIVVMDKK